MEGSGQIPVRIFKPDGGTTRLWVKMYYDPCIGPTRLLAPRSLMHMEMRQDPVKGFLINMKTKAVGKVKYVNGLAYVDGPASEQWNHRPDKPSRDDDTASSTPDDHLRHL